LGGIPTVGIGDPLERKREGSVFVKKGGGNEAEFQNPKGETRKERCYQIPKTDQTYFVSPINDAVLKRTSQIREVKGTCLEDKKEPFPQGKLHFPRE